MAASLWQRKLMALLHDPPEKSFDYGPDHEARAEANATAFGLDRDLWKAFRSSDWSSAAADRFIMPSGQKIHQGLGGGVRFVHPFSGQPAFDGKDFPGQDEAHDLIGQVRPDFRGADLSDRDRFFLIWRLWMEYAARGQHRDSPRLPYLPADTRVPDSTIWLHNAIASAIEATRDEQGFLKPAFLLFQVGPVQEFIAQARTTRDLWSGSYLLSWLMAHAMKALSDQVGPDCVMFPSLRGQPLFDWLHRETLQKARYPDSKSYWDSITEKNKTAFEEMVLSPCLPNRFLAVVPADFDPGPVAQAFQAEWQTIANTCQDWLARHGCPIPQADRFQWQAQHQWQIAWQVWPWTPTQQALQRLAAIPGGAEDPLQTACEIAKSIPKGDKDTRCYRDGDFNPGWAWSAHYQLCQHRLAARRQTRDFEAWQGADKAVKDVYSGKEETVIDEPWLEQARARADVQYLFRGEHKEFLGAANLVKRVWHKAHLEPLGLKRARWRFDSVPAVAAAPWLARVPDRLREDAKAWEAMLAFKKAVEKAAPCEVPAHDEPESLWLSKVDAGVFQESFWNEALPEEQEAVRALRALLRNARAGRPATYYAILALDGDRMGQWLSGTHNPPVASVITPAAAAYFRERVQHARIEDWLAQPRPVSPSFHLQFSEALSNFAIYAARRLVEQYHGQLIYAGGDDVLAMLPAETAISCARALRRAFQGDTALARQFPALFQKAPEGFIQLAEGDWNAGARRPAEPSWPLLVPGPKATVSVGLAVGHVREPLQDMIEAARDAEKRAKTAYGRDALALTLFKRSGEQIQWGVKFAQAAPFQLLEFLDQYYKPPVDDPKKPMPISGRFPYRLIALLRPYEDPPRPGRRAGETPLTAALAEIVKKELAWLIGRGPKEHADIYPELQARCRAWLEALATPEARSDGKEPVPPRAADFYNLFAVEAFIARQGQGE